MALATTLISSWSLMLTIISIKLKMEKFKMIMSMIKDLEMIKSSSSRNWY